MLRIIQNQNAASAASYYSQSDYYSEGQELVGQWGGQAAELLGLEGEVDRHSFQRMCENRHPFRNQHLTARTRTDRTVGYDFNFHAPKSVSVLYATTRDERILRAFRHTVMDTMNEMERFAKTRVRKRGVMAERKTGKLAWAEFVHFTARPVRGKVDPHLHAHCFTFNCTHDATEDAWKAVQFRDIKQDAPFYEAVFHAQLADRMRELGYGIDRVGKFWEVAGIEPAILQEFSQRKSLIDQKAAEKNITNPDRKSELGALTREAKTKELSPSELRDSWIERMTTEQSQQVQSVHAAATEGRIIKPSVTAEEALEFAIDHHFEQASVVPTRSLLETALRFGSITLADLERELPNSDLIIREVNGRSLATSHDVLAEEQRMLAFARDGKATRKPLNPDWQIQRTILSQEQRAAVNHIVNSTDRVLLLRGKAGTGKTELTKETVDAIQATGKPVLMLAPSVEASRVILRGEGFETADTVAQFLKNPKLEDLARDGVIWVDEAGLLGTRDLSAVFEKAEQLNARVILAGDNKQHSAVQRGDALRLLETESGLKAAELREIHRQKGDYAAAVSLIASGEVLKGFDALDKLGWVEELSATQRSERVASEFAEAARKKTELLVVAPTHAESDPLTAAIRGKLKSTLDQSQRPLLAAKDHEVPRLVSKHLTEAQRRDPTQYENGDVILLTQNAKGYKRGTRLVYSPEWAGKLQELAPRIEVYHATTMPMAVGERIRMTGAGTTLDGHRLNNGSRYQVQQITAEGQIVLNNGWKLDSSWGLWAPAYVSTSHSSQGKTVKGKVILCQSALSHGAASLNQFYVSISRATKNLLILCESKDELRDQIQRTESRMTATELVKPKRPNLKQSRTRFVNRLTSIAQTVQSRFADWSHEPTRSVSHAR